MTFFQSIKTVFTKYAEFTGRASRSEFWWFTLFSTLVSAALNALSVPMYSVMYTGMLHDGPMFTGGYSSFSFAGLWSIAVLLPSLAVTVRRLRDAGHSWTNLFWILLPLAGLIVLIVLLCQPSIPGGAATPAMGNAAATPEVPAGPRTPL
jgi:uncharacterized membrane protein YhaH (DUF805 family)